MLILNAKRMNRRVKVFVLADIEVYQRIRQG